MCQGMCYDTWKRMSWKQGMVMMGKKVRCEVMERHLVLSGGEESLQAVVLSDKGVIMRVFEDRVHKGKWS
jgi:hypothetical protein